MNLMAGLLRPTGGTISVMGIPPGRPEQLYRVLGYATQYDTFPAGMTGRRFLETTLTLHGVPPAEVAERARQSLERVNLVDAADRKVAGYSKGMRQRLRLAQAIAPSRGCCSWTSR
jgi:ABC-2 type transport system ATP-binding protein